MKPKVVVYKTLSAELLARLKSVAEVVEVPDPKRHGLDALKQALPGAHGLLGASLAINPPLLDLAPQLRAIATVSVGIDNYDVADLDRRGIQLCNTPDVLTETTADTALALILASARRVVELAIAVREGRWTRSIGPAEFGTDVHGKTLGIVGLGRIGQAVARRANLGFGMPILYSAGSPKPEAEAQFGARRRELDQLLMESDFVCLTVPLNADTEGLIGARELNLMKPGAILVNIARGPVVDEQALVEALRHGKIRGAGLDVFHREPLPEDSPLLALDNVVATPHIGSATEETREAMARCAVDNLISALAGERPANLVNPGALSAR